MAGNTAGSGIEGKRSLEKSFAWAFRGIRVTFKSQRNFRIHVAATCLAVAMGIYLGLSAIEWGLLVVSIGLVLAAELFNTAIERLGDAAAGGRQNHVVGNAKDIAAAAVLVSAIAALIVGIVILIIPFVNRVLELR